MIENKQLICNKMLELFQATMYFSDLVSLTYVYNWDDESKCHINEEFPATEYVVATFNNGHKKYANVSIDSGYAMIKDVLKQIA